MKPQTVQGSSQGSETNLAMTAVQQEPAVKPPPLAVHKLSSAASDGWQASLATSWKEPSASLSQLCLHLHWGLGLVAGALMARQVAGRLRRASLGSPVSRGIPSFGLFPKARDESMLKDSREPATSIGGSHEGTGRGPHHSGGHKG